MSSALLKLSAFIFLSLFIITTSISVSPSCTKNSNNECTEEQQPELDVQAIWTCYGINNTHPFVCSGNGNCSMDGNCTCGNDYLGLQCQYKPAQLDLSVQIVMISFASISAVGTIIGLSVAFIAIGIYLIQDCINSRKDLVLQQKLNNMNRELKKGYHEV
eukprot:gene7069-11232_t